LIKALIKATIKPLTLLLLLLRMTTITLTNVNYV
jgi:hypothetical protein